MLAVVRPPGRNPQGSICVLVLALWPSSPSSLATLALRRATNLRWPWPVHHAAVAHVIGHQRWFHLLLARRHILEAAHG